MVISRRCFGKALGFGGALGLLGCSGKGLRAGGFGEVELEAGLAVLRLPGNFRPLRGEQIRRRSRSIGVAGGPSVELKGDVVLDLIHMNFWALSHVFALGEEENAAGKKSIEGLLLISRLADAKSFARPQAFLETAAMYSPDKQWTAAGKLQWKTQVEAKHYQVHEGEWAGGFAVVLEDRERLLEAIYFGRAVKGAVKGEVAIAKEILRNAVESYILRQPLDAYFRQVNLGVEAMAQGRRKHYTDLLETLQAEGLDYSPAPLLVRFNRNLVCRFYWPAYDRSGVPLEISFAARLGVPLKPMEEDLKSKLRVGELIVLGKEAKGREADLARDAGWVEESVAVAGLSFSFSEEIPDLSGWLDDVEALSREGARRELWEAGR